MIKGIFEKIILNTFGHMIKGFQKDKLSVDLFGGNFQLQNISLNHDFFNSLNSPFTLTYSSIGKLNLQASISKISSVPVECLLDNIFVIVKFKEGSGQTLSTVRGKKDKIFKEIGEVLESSLKKVNQEKKEDGMMARLGKKIIDNLQLKVMNVHIRFEQSSSNEHQTYAWGLTLKQINFTTTDKNWKPCFVEHTHESKQKLFKMMAVDNLNFYWQAHHTHEDQLLTSENHTDQDRKDRLAEMIQAEENVVFSITSSFKLVINPLQDLEAPLYEVNIDLEPLKFEFQRSQIAQMADFARKNVMQNENIVRSMNKKSKIKLTEEQKDNYRHHYEAFVDEVLNCHVTNKRVQTVEGYDDVLIQIFEKIEESELTMWELKPIKSKVKVIREQEIKKKKGGWFSRGPDQLSKEERDELQKYIDESFEGQKYRREPHLLFFRVNVELKGCTMILVEFKNQEIEESIHFNVGKVVTSVAKSQDQSYFQAFLELESISSYLYLPFQKNNQTKQKKLEIFTTDKPQQYKENSDDQDSMKSFDSCEEEEEEKKSFLKIMYKSELLEKNTVLKKTVDGNMQKMTVIYKKIYMQKFRKFIDFKKTSQNIVKAPPIDQYETFIEEETMPQEDNFKLDKILDVKLDINSPVFICPLNENQCWCLYFGSLNIKSNRSQGFQEFPMVVNSAFLRYYPFMKECYQLKDSRMRKEIFSLINDMDFTITYQQFKDKNEEIFSIDLPSFKVNFTQKQYENLMSLTKIFQVQESQKQSMVELLKQERKLIEANKSFEGSIMKKHDTTMSWKKHHGIISGEYLYLYNDRKELRENTKIILKNTKAIIINNEGQEDTSKQIELINQNQIWTLSCQNIQELQQWFSELDKKCRSFKTIHELMKQYQMSQNEGKKEHHNQESRIQTRRRKILKFTVSQVEFRYIGVQGDSLMEYQVKQIFFSRQNMQQESQKFFTMKQLLITDKIYKFTNPVYQILIRAHQVSYQELKGKKNAQGKRKTNISLSVQDLFINWKPDVLLLLMQLVNKHFQTEKVHRIDDDIEQSRQEHFKEVHNDTKFMTMRDQYRQKGKNIQVKGQRDQLSVKSNWMKETMATEVKLNKIEINMIHRESHLVMLKMQSSNINCLLEVCSSERFIKGTIDTLDVYDMTGYPQKQYSPEVQHEPYKIMTKVRNDSEKFIEFRWGQYDMNTFPNEEKVDSFMWIAIAPLSYQYYQQMSFRIIDYLLIQVILLINQPEMLTVNENLMEQLKQQRNVEEKPIKVLFSQYKEVIKKLVHPSFMDMYFKLEQPTLIIKSEKKSHIYYKLTMNELTVFNRNAKSNKRFERESNPQLKDLIFEEEYIIEGTDCRFNEVVESKHKEEQLFEPFKIGVQFNKLLFEDQINLLFPEVSNYDRSFVTINKVSNITLPHLSRLQYLNINKLVNFNFTFDDQCDELFIHNFKVTKLLSPKPIVYQVVVPEVHMTADYNASQNTQQIWKLFKASIYNFTMEFKRTKQLDSSFSISLGLTEFRGFEYKDGEKQPKQYDLMSLCGEEFGKTSTDIVVENKTTGRKIINMNVTEMNMTVRTGLLQLIFEYTLVEDWIFPEVNKFVPELIFCATVCRMNSSVAEDVDYVASQLRKKKTSPKVIKDVLNHKFGMGTFVLEGVLCYKFHRRRDETIQEYQNKLKRTELKFADFEKMEAVSTMSAILNTEVYRAWTTSAAKRKIVQKFTFTFEDRRFLKVADEDHCIIKTAAKRGMSIDHWLVKVSFKDIILMMSILSQVAEERKYINYLYEKTGKRMLSQLDPSRETESSSLQSLDLNIENLSFYLLNARRDIFIPILKVTINRVNLGKSNTFKKDILKGDLNIAIYYFNNQIFRWEPMVEKVNLFFHKLIYYQQNNNVFGSLETQGPIMINISREIFGTLKETASAWKKQSQEEENKYTVQIKDIEPLTFISHYIVRNETGYLIELLSQKNQLIRKIPHNQQIDYEYEITDYDEQNEPEIFIGFRIVHPKHAFMAIKNITFSHVKEHEIMPRLAIKGANPILNTHSKIIIKPEIKDCKKIMMIKSSKYVYHYFDGECQVNALPFDHDQYYTLPKEIHNELKVSLYEEKSTEYYRYIGKDGILKIMKKNIVYNYSPIPLQICGKMVKPNEYVGISQKLKIQDIPYKDSILKVKKNEKQKEYYIFAECYVVDYYGLHLQFEKEYRSINKLYCHKHNTEDYNCMVYLLPDTDFKFKVSMGKQSSRQTIKTDIGKSHFILQTNKSLLPFTVYSYLSPLQNQKLSEFRTVIQITPQYMLSNATKSLIKISQVESCNSISLEPYQRIPFVWENKTKPRLIKLALYDGTDFWGYSGQLSIEKSTQSIVLRKMSDPITYRILSIQIEKTNTVTFIHIVLPSPKYMIKNDVKGSNLLVYQHAIMDEHLDHQHSFPKEFIFNVAYHEEKPFGYELPLYSHKIQVKVELDHSLPQFNGMHCDVETFEDFETSIEVKNIMVRNQKRKITNKLWLILCFENNIKKLKLQRENDVLEEENTYEYLLKIPQIGISFIGMFGPVRKEIIHVSFTDINMELLGNRDFNDMNLIVGHCRIQNELKYEAFYPVIFESVHTKEAKYFINFMINRSGTNSRLIHYIGISINKSWLTVTSEELQILQQNFHKILQLNNRFYDHIRTIEMFNKNLPDPEQSLFFREGVIHPLRSNITFKHVNQWGGRLLKTLSSINECPISAEGLVIRQFSCPNMGAYFSHLLKHYQDGMSKMILPMIGNLAILGSPITFVQKVGSGVKDLVQLPAEGFQISALKGVGGALRGAGSLLSKSISGAFNTVQSLTGSISNGITLLVDDDKTFTREREVIKNDRSNHIIGGLFNGGKSIAFGFKNGFTGLVTQPVQGAERNGLPGFLLGAVKGLGGLVIKPVSGVIDAASKTAEGIKNTPQFFSDERKQKFRRKHNPRPFYNFYKEYRNYDFELAELIRILADEDERYVDLSWCGHYQLIGQKESSKPFLLLSYEYFFIFDIRKKKLVQKLHCDTFLSVTVLEDDHVRVKLYDKKKGKEGFVKFLPDSACRKIAYEIGVIIRHFSPNFIFV